MQDEIKLLGLTEAAKVLQISVNRLRYLVDTRALPSTRDSAKRRIVLSIDVEAFKRKREAEKNGRTLKLLRLRAKD